MDVRPVPARKRHQVHQRRHVLGDQGPVQRPQQGRPRVHDGAHLRDQPGVRVGGEVEPGLRHLRVGHRHNPRRVLGLPEPRLPHGPLDARRAILRRRPGAEAVDAGAAGALALEQILENVRPARAVGPVQEDAAATLPARARRAAAGEGRSQHAVLLRGGVEDRGVEAVFAVLVGPGAVAAAAGAGGGGAHLSEGGDCGLLDR